MRRLLPLLLLLGCSEGFDESNLTPRVTPIYSPSQGALPVPNDLLYSGSTDATLNAPVADASDVSDPTVGLNALTGWSTSGPFVLGFGDALDFTSAVAGDSVRLFQVTTAEVPGQPVGTPVTGVVAELDGNAFSVGEAAEDESESTLRISPLAPLQAGATYMVVVTDSLLGEDGRAVVRSTEYSLASAEDPYSSDHPFASLRDLVAAQQAAAEAAGVDRDSIVLSYTFTTQHPGTVLSNLRAISLDPSGTTEGLVIAGLCDQLPSGCVGEDTDPDPRSVPTASVPDTALGTTLDFLGAGGLARVYQGSLTLPYFLENASNTTDTGTSNDATPLSTRWRSRFAFTEGETDRHVTAFNPLPAIQSAEEIPLLVTVPNTGAPPADGWPVVIFQHGITRNRADLLLIADSLAFQGLAAVSIDMPLHGLVENNSIPTLDALFEGYLDDTLRERTYGIDLVANDTGAPGPDGQVDESGTHYLNLSSLLSARDNVGQSIADLFQLTSTLGSIDVIDNTTGANGMDGNPDFDTDRIHFVGQSLGAMVGCGFVASEARIQSATLGMPGGGIPYVLNSSATFGDTLVTGLAAAGILDGTPEYEAYLFAAQAILDSIDPLAFAAALGAGDTPLHLIEVVGGGPGGGLTDQTIPNTTEGAPLGGTEGLIAVIGLDNVTTTLMDMAGVSGAVRFHEGTHGSLINPGTTMAEMAAFAEMQLQTSLFASSSGTQLVVTDGTVIAIP